MKKVIFVCRGNVIRSQICKAFYNNIATDGSVAEGYGTMVKEDGNEGVRLIEHKYLSNLLNKMKEFGMDISHEHSRQLTEEVLKDNPKIIVMGKKEKIPSWLEKYNYEYWEDCSNELEKNKENNLNKKDPSFVNEENMENTILFLKEKVKNLIQNML